MLEQDKLEEWILLAVLAADTLDANTVNSFYSMIKAPAPLSERYLSPIQRLEKKRQEKTLKETMEEVGLGDKHRMFSRCLKELAEKNPSLMDSPPERLEEVYGVSQKAARLFLLFTRNEDVVCVNEPVIKLAEEKGVSLPKTINTKKQYEKAEQAIRKLAEKENTTVTDLQFSIFSEYLAQ